jgi:hypothetical protein
MQATLASIRSRTGHFAQSNGFWSPRLSGDRDPSYFSLRLFFHHHDEKFVPKKNRVVRQLPNGFSHSIIHIRDGGVGLRRRALLPSARNFGNFG